MKLKHLIFLVLVFFASSYFYAQEGAVPNQTDSARSFKNFGGRRLPDEDMECRLIALRFFEDDLHPGFVVFDFAFTKGIDPLTVKKNKIQINGKFYNGHIAFKRNSRAFRFIININELGNIKQNFTVSLIGIKTYDDEELPRVDLYDLQVNNSYKYSVREGLWKKY